MDLNFPTVDRKLRTNVWNVTAVAQNLGTMHRNMPPPPPPPPLPLFDFSTNGNFAEGLYFMSSDGFYRLSLSSRILYVLWFIQGFYYPILAMFGVPGKFYKSYLTLFLILLFTLLCYCCYRYCCVSILLMDPTEQ